MPCHRSDLSLSDGLVTSTWFVRLTVREEPVDQYTDDGDCDVISEGRIVGKCSGSLTDKHQHTP